MEFFLINEVTEVLKCFGKLIFGFSNVVFWYIIRLCKLKQPQYKPSAASAMEFASAEW